MEKKNSPNQATGRYSELYAPGSSSSTSPKLKQDASVYHVEDARAMGPENRNTEVWESSHGMEENPAFEQGHAYEYLAESTVTTSPNSEDAAARFLGLSEGAQFADAVEKHMSLVEGVRQYPHAALWSVVLSSALVMEGYDTALLASLYALPAFARRFGVYNDAAGIYEVPARWQTILGMCTNIGEVVGLQLAGIAADRFGYRRTLIAAMFGVFCFVFVLVFANSCTMLAVGEILCGVPWGCFQTLTLSYATEVCPLVLRYYLTTYVNVCWVLGQILAAAVLRESQNHLAHSEWAFRLPFALQWAWPLPLAVGIYLAPESPWWLVKKGRFVAARVSLARLVTGLDLRSKNDAIDAMLKRMKLTTEKEETLCRDARYVDCFRGVDARRTRIACLTWITQNACGSAMMGYSTYFYVKAGLSEARAFDLTVAQYCFGLLGTIASWFIARRYGRFTIFSTGLALQSLLLLSIGMFGLFFSSQWASSIVGALLLLFVFVYDVGVGPVTYCIVPEIPSTRLRTKTVVLARNCYNTMGILNAIWTPYMLNSTQWNWGAKTGLFWGAIAAIMLLWAVSDLPETKDRTFGEIDELFAQKVPARGFVTTSVDPYDGARLMGELNKDQISRLVSTESGPSLE
ncbi:LAFE_0C05732g1_1 [Lachancea fermentati]|uniref:LAFE_0C05732g1_1 n=1 Tax=Lachancea fermentati TaxID=4955 RepID=A0A1G4M9Y0_LACFM|nr:LAFE_0C05732g1_1 [Lachancea fermentati]